MKCIFQRAALSASIVTIAALWLSEVAVAAEPPSASSVDDMLDMSLDKLIDIVVTGAASARGIPKQQASYAITTLTEQAIRDIQPASTADPIRLVPGMWAETTGGVSGPNVSVRGFPTTGDTPWASLQLDGMPIFAVATLSWLDNFTQFRLDDTVQRMEATISGPAVLWGTGQPGATVNFIQKNGRDNPGSSLRLTTGTGELARLDGYFGGKIADGWYASIGGFARQDKGVRNTQYPADQGYQLVGTLTHDTGDGKMTLYGRVTEDRNAFFTGMPLQGSGSGSDTSISGYPGFNPLTATFYGNATRYVTIATAPGETQTLDMSKGRGIQSQILGFNIDKKFGRIEFSDKMTYVNARAFTTRQETGPLPQTLAAFIASEVALANGNSAALGAAGGVLATGGTATFAGSGQAITDMTQPVIGINVGMIDKQFSAYQNEARLSLPLSDKNTLTLGAYFANYRMTQTDEKGAYQLLQVTSNPQVVNVVLNNGVLATSPDGIFAPVTGANSFAMQATNIAAIVEDEWQASDKLRLDIGYRIEHVESNGTGQNKVQGNASSNPLALYAYNTTYRVPGTTSYQYDGIAHAITTGAGYEIERDLNAFIRYNQGYQFPNFDSVTSGQLNITRVEQVQAGFKVVRASYSAGVTAFFGTFTGQPQSQTLIDGTKVNYVLSSRTKGVEIEGVARLSERLQVALTGNYVKAELTAGGPGITGNDVVRQPTVQMHITPSYTIPTSFAQFRLYTTANYVGQRWSDPQNSQRLPAYQTVDVGVVADFKNRISLQLTGTNVTNTVAITEGNPRVVSSGAGANSIFVGRPLFGANYQISALMRF